MSNVVTVKKILETIEKAHLVNDVNALALDRPLSEQGVDSLDFSGILFNLEEVFGVEIPDEDIASLQTINSILIVLKQNKEIFRISQKQSISRFCPNIILFFPNKISLCIYHYRNFLFFFQNKIRKNKFFSPLIFNFPIS